MPGLWDNLMSLSEPQQRESGLYESLIQGHPYPAFRRSENIDDRRDRPDMTPEWRNVPGSLSAVATSLGNSVWGTPQIPEAPDTQLSDALGKRDIKLIPQINSRSPLQQGIDTISDELSMFRKAFR